MSRVLTLDLGITTGFCVRELNGDLLSLGIVAWPDSENGEDTGEKLEENFHALVQLYLPSFVVVEAPVLIARGELQGNLATIIRAAKNVFRQHTEWVTPAQWKPRFGKIPVRPLPEQGHQLTPHERDAYRIAEWWLKTSQR